MSGGSDGLIGQYVSGFLDACDIPRKVICADVRMHESTLSRKLNDIDLFQDKELFRVGVAVGKAIREAAK